MNILILNGSPKGKYSTTLQTCLYISKLFKHHTYTILNVGVQIRKFESDFSEAKAALDTADLIVFSYPVYTFLVPSQLHRFIELIKENEVNLQGKVATQITTSKHFFDTTAHRFIQDNCADLGLNYIKGLSADMEDLLCEKGQKEASDFFKMVEFSIDNQLFELPSVTHLSETVDNYESFSSLRNEDKLPFGETIIVADLRENDLTLRAMIEDFQSIYPYPARLINIAEFPFSGGCISCFNCASSGKCIHKDGFDSFLRNEIQKGVATIFAFSLKDHSMGSRFKMYDDRQFCNGHRTVTIGMPMAYIINGKMENEENLRTIIEARCDVGKNPLCGIATNRESIEAMALRLKFSLDNHYTQPQQFYGVGGTKVFRPYLFDARLDACRP